MHGLRVFFQSFDVILFGTVVILTSLGLATMYSYQGDNAYFNRQVLWIGIALGAFFLQMARRADTQVRKLPRVQPCHSRPLARDGPPRGCRIVVRASDGRVRSPSGFLGADAERRN